MQRTRCVMFKPLALNAVVAASLLSLVACSDSASVTNPANPASGQTVPKDDAGGQSHIDASSGGGDNGGQIDAGAPPAVDGGSGPDRDGKFIHPGVLVSRGMLDFVRAKIAAGEQPWTDAFNAAKGDNLGRTSYTPKPRADVNCGPSSNPDNGCTDEKNDVAAAYTAALLWAYTGKQDYADTSIRIMNAWSSTLQKHSGANEPLQAAWCAEVFPRAAEIIRYTGAGWPDDEMQRFADMLKKVYLPEVEKGTTVNGNWETSMIEATINIAVFLDDKDHFDSAIAMWRKRTPAYVYLASDGAMPVQPPNDPRSDDSLRGYWYNPSKFIDGLTQESCRDKPNSGTQGFGHAQYGVAGIFNAAETARIQGVDLFSAEQPRLTTMLEFHSKYLNGQSTSGLCQSTIEKVSPDPMWEIAYNAYANVLHQSLPETKKLIENNRPFGATHHMVWETLTHAEIGAAGL